jgi:hypothetical protein
LKLLYFVFLFKFVYLAAFFNQQAFGACVERMAFGANLHFDVAFCRTGGKSITAGTGYGYLIVFGMDILFHSCSPLSVTRIISAVLPALLLI